MGDAVPCHDVPAVSKGRAGKGRVQSGFSPPAQIQSGIGRLILREEMKARSNSYADPWTPPRSSASSREALHTAGYEGSLNGCKDNPVHLSIPPGTAPALVGSLLGWREKEQRTGKGVVGEVLGTRVGLGRLFSSLEGSIHSLCSSWDGALPWRVLQSVPAAW